MRELMRILTVALLSATLLVLIPDSYADGRTPLIPAEFRPGNPYADGPVWIQSAEAISADGKLLESRLATSTLIKLKYFLAKAVTTGQQPCDLVLGSLIDDVTSHAPVASLSDVKARARRGRTITGTITATAVGLYSGSPFTVLQITSAGEPHPLYLLHPRGAIEIEGKRICRNDSQYAVEPQLGDRVIAVLDHSVDADNLLYRVQAELLFFERNGEAVVSGRLRRAQPSEARSFEALSRELLETSRYKRTH